MQPDQPPNAGQIYPGYLSTKDRETDYNPIAPDKPQLADALAAWMKNSSEVRNTILG